MNNLLHSFTSCKLSAREIVCFTIGASMLLLFLRRSFYGVILLTTSDPLLNFSLFLLTAALMSGGLLILRAKIILTIDKHPTFFIFISTLITLSLLALSVNEKMGAPLYASWVSSFSYGLAFPLLTILWGQSFLWFVAKDRLWTLCSIILAFIIGFIISTITVPLGSNAIFLFAFFPLFSTLCWRCCYRKGPLPSSKLVRLKQLPFYCVFPGICLLLMSFLRGLYYTGSISYRPGWDVLVPHSLSILMGLIMLILLLFHTEIRSALNYSVILFALLLLAGLLLGTYGHIEALSLQLTIVGKSCFELLLIIILVDSARDLRISSPVLFVPSFLTFELLSLWVSYYGVPALVKVLEVTFPGAISFFSLIIAFLFIGSCFLYLILNKKDTAPKEIVSQVDSDNDALRYNNNEVMRKKLETFPNYNKLTPREIEIALLLAQGNSYKRVAEILFISSSTVQTHAKSLYRKLQIHTKQELIDNMAKNDSKQ